ncbi:LysM domain-containing protein [Lactococcus lactis]|uniref:SAG1386/EF1546 family surface-associated protein n=1 Tax=Lactococcus lactis TaxID=1358 RepID=UPI00223A7228|nr:SAG1386/EF1546 family surface-associated protein [Lactococcus lactis]MCT1184731.1 LysM domain-containing protein [Lactococcus lactis]MCT1188649.1 LysM domain-containing protein [Lactococcus lactis]
MSTKEPWDNEIYSVMKKELTEMKGYDRGKYESKLPVTARSLTILVILIFIPAIGFILWNNQARNTSSIANSSRQSSSLAKTEKSSSQATAASSSNVIQESWTTYKIAIGDYPSTIAAKTGVSWATIASLNGITEAGYNADGSPIHAGQLLKLK